MSASATPAVEAKWLIFEYVGASKSGKTEIWSVLNKGTMFNLGTISWSGRWRKYAFSPSPDTIFEQQCLHDIAEFCEEATALHALARKEKVDV